MAPSEYNTAQDAIQQWNTNFSEGRLEDSHFRSYWKNVIPTIFRPDPTSETFVNLGYDEGRIKQLLLEPMENFITNGRRNEVFHKLGQLENPPALCGKEFKQGEQIYKCNDCVTGIFTASALCSDCFKTSSHRNHNYAISKAGDDDICECGDKQAWKNDAFCEQHKEDTEQPNAENGLNKYPKEVVDRGRVIISAVVNYCYQMLVWNDNVKLPNDLSGNEEEFDNYCVLLYNDEVHTHNQAKQAIKMAVRCSEADAGDYTTAVTREGRNIIMCSKYLLCSDAKSLIEKNSAGKKSLEVKVLHSNIIAHQVFAMKLLKWLKKLLGLSQCFRLLFSETMLKSDASTLESIMKSDSRLWKAARRKWHKLLISGMIRNIVSKKPFTKEFIRNYQSLLSNVLSPDTDYFSSILSMSAVHLFVRPSWVNALIIEEDVLSVLMKTFLNECQHNLNNEGRLSFKKNESKTHFERAQYIILLHLRYLLRAKPDQWTEQLRKNFLSGFHHMLTLLSWMQGMDSVVHQVEQLKEFEPDNEIAFKLNSRVSDGLSLMLDWCGSDRTLLVESFRSTLKKMYDIQGAMVTFNREVVDHTATCIDYNIGSQPVSIHIPLSRLIAGFRIHLDKHGLSYDSIEFQDRNKPTLVELMELPLRTQVMIAQVHAGMWGNDNFALTNQISFYNSAKYRTYMLDKDIVMLQTGAALLESNELLINLLNKFGLMNWVREDYETCLNTDDDSMKETISLVEDFLGLLIVIISERFTPGVGRQVTEKERVLKEVIQQLCMEPSLSLTQLFEKAYPEDEKLKSSLWEIIKDVATFHPGSMFPNITEGFYELKPEFYKEFNLFFYHYSRAEHSKAEVGQRRRRKESKQDECIPPSRPPPLCSSYSTLVNFLQCDVMLHITRVILERAAIPQARSFSELQLHKILYLIGFAIYEEQRCREINDSSFCFTEKAESKGILTQLESLVRSGRIGSQNDLLKWTIKTFKNVESL